MSFLSIPREIFAKTYFIWGNLSKVNLFDYFLTALYNEMTFSLQNTGGYNFG